jgi:hypothetical protein
MHDQRGACDRRRRRVASLRQSRSSRRSSGTAIGEFVVRPGPDVLRRIEFGRVRREVVNVKSGMVGQERSDLAMSMDRAAIPQQVDGTAEVAEQMLEEGADVEAREISRPTPEIERQVPPPWRHGQSAADRQPIVAVAVAQARRLPARCPRPADVGDKQKAALIDEHEMGATSSGVFLSAAMPHASTG